MLDLFAPDITITTKRTYLGSVSEESRCRMKFFYLNHDEFERWDVQILKTDGTPGLNLTYSVKEFLMSFSLKGTRNNGLYVARFSNIRRKALEKENELTLSICFEEYKIDIYEPIKEYDIKLNWEKGRPLHDVWIILAESVLEDFLGVKNESENPLIEGRLLKR